MKISFVMVGLWWAGFSQYTFHYLPKNQIQFPKKDILKKSILFGGFYELNNVWKMIKKQESIKKFLLAFFVFSCALQTII